ncbi:RIP metalloprotease RseP [Paenibacillus yanchengensis]|uniref:Zinc metalloprotease n=1 Tax=Paenibacillus yanchengensis TaxID=2035833 RepID=A0ABW4YML7_9BACL
MQTIQVVFSTVMVFFVIISIHELGHFIFAKRAGILVREFAIGFGPKLLAWKKNETNYTLRLLPIGGYVRMAGEDPELVEVQPGQTVAVRLKDNIVTRIYLDRLDERSNVMRGEVESVDIEHKLTMTLLVDGVSESYPVARETHLVARGMETQIAPYDRQFNSKTVGQRAMTIFAGPMMNFILAFGLFIAYVQMAGVNEKILVNEVMENMPAATTELQQNDEIKAVNGQEIGIDYDLMLDIIGVSAGKPIVMDILRDGQPLQVTLTPVANEDGIGKIGLVSKYGTRSATLSESFTQPVVLMKDMTVTIFQSLKMLFTLQFKLDDLAGPVRTAEITSEIARQGIVQLTRWTGLLSLYLGIFNLLPVPALDGSRLMFLGLEAVRRRPIEAAKEGFVHFIGFAMLMILMLVVTYNDILRLIRGE